MSKALRISSIVIGILVASAALLWTGIMIGRSTLAAAGFFPGGMIGYQTGYAAGQNTVQVPYDMMGGGMMGGYTGSSWQENSQYGYGMMGQGVAPGYGGMGMMGPSMMGGNTSGGLSAVEPLSIDQAQEALHGYLNRLNNPDLEVKEVMIFDNQAYAEIVEKSTGIGAMEVLIDPLTLAVYPEYGPNMMWNLKYGMMSGAGANGMMGNGMMGNGMMGAGSQNTNGTADVSEEMPVSPEQAVEAAQQYLDRYYAGKQVEDHADTFYGYYTLHVLSDGEVVGMLSVNGDTGQVFPHTWHGDFVEMSEEE